MIGHDFFFFLSVARLCVEGFVLRERELLQSQSVSTMKPQHIKPRYPLTLWSMCVGMMSQFGEGEREREKETGGPC